MWEERKGVVIENMKIKVQIKKNVAIKKKSCDRKHGNQSTP